MANGSIGHPAVQHVPLSLYSLLTATSLAEKITHKTHKVQTCILIVDINCLSLRLFTHGKLCI